MTEVNSTRQCNKCSTVTDQYYKSNPATCKECIKAGVRQNRANNIEYYREYDRARKPVKYNRIQSEIDPREAYRRRNPKARFAHEQLAYAVKLGIIEKPDTCSECGDKHDLIHGHHDDYSKPLDVMWVCPHCHKAIHSGMPF